MVELLVSLCGVTKRELLQEALVVERLVQGEKVLLSLFPDPDSV